MVAYARDDGWTETMQGQGHVEARPVVVCTGCSRVLPQYNHKIVELPGDTWALFTWCERCNTGAEVVYFKRDGKETVHKGRQWVIEGGRHVPKKWVIINEMTAPVVTGTGGDYKQDYTPEISNALVNIKSVLESLAKTVGLLYNAIVGK
jgi:hypothetical protein